MQYAHSTAVRMSTAYRVYEKGGEAEVPSIAEAAVMQVSDLVLPNMHLEANFGKVNQLYCT
jgi:hypothetical protein